MDIILYLNQDVIDFLLVSGIKYGVFRHGVRGDHLRIGGEMHKAVAEFPHRAVVLAQSRRIEDARARLCMLTRAGTQDFHRRLEQQEQVIPAPVWPVDDVMVGIGEIVSAVVGFEHGGGSFRR